MTPFELLEPRSMRKAIALLDPDDSGVRPISGGTALLLMMKAGVFRPTRLVSLRSVEQRYAAIRAAADGSLRIGALATLSAMAASPAVRRALPVVTQTLRTLSNVRVRNVATLGGHLAHADPHLDLPPLLIALGASITATGPAGERSIAVENLFTGYYGTALAADELITQVAIPSQRGKRAAYVKCTARSADDWPSLGVAVVLDTNEGEGPEGEGPEGEGPEGEGPEGEGPEGEGPEGEGPDASAANIVISAATEMPVRLRAAEAVLRGGVIDEAAIRAAGETAADEAQVIGDTSGSAAYKKQLVRVQVARAIRLALESATSRPASRSRGAHGGR